ncbi:hypothetical protein KR093_005211, partial [Drosophila rubida]
TKMLDVLNDDCQLAIIKCLNLTDQFALYEATEGYPNRLNSNITFAWEHQLCFELDGKSYDKFEEVPELLNIFLSSINATVQELKLEWVTIDILKRWESYTFCSMKALEYKLDDCNCDVDDANEAIKIIAKLFPGLRSVKPYGGFDCSHLPIWTQLRKLDLSEWSPSSVMEYSSVQEITKCLLLEELILSYYFEWPGIYDVVMVLPKLHTLSFSLKDDDLIFVNLLEKRGKEVHTIIFNDCIWEYKVPTLHKMSNLRHLTLLEDDGFTSEMLLELVADLKHLEQIDLVDCQLWTGEEELWRTVASCPSLRTLNISGMQLYENFFEFSRRVMDKTLNNRAQPLTLHCHNTGNYEELVS